MDRGTETSHGKTSRSRYSASTSLPSYHSQHQLQWTLRSKQRASMSFFIVIMFFVVLVTIVFMEVFFIDERTRTTGFIGRHGSGVLSYRSSRSEKEDYDILQADSFVRDSVENEIEALLLGEHMAIPVVAGGAVKPKNLLSNSLQASNDQTLYNVPLVDGIWQPVSGTKNKFFVYSAYLDRREKTHFVRIIAATKTRGADSVVCRFWYPVLEKNVTTYVSMNITANVKVIRENWNLKYSAVYVLCPLKRGQAVPFAVSVFSKTSPTPTNMLFINNFYNETKLPTNKYAVCVKPLHYNYNKVMQILEFIELNRILGVEHFIFYNHSIGSQVDCLLREYISKGIITLLPWELDIVSQKEIRTEGLFAALNDCLYRTMYKYSHVLFIDYDEYIIPRSKKTLPELIEYLDTRRKSGTVGAYSFQNAFFYLQWEDDEWVLESYDEIAVSLVTQTKSRRKAKLHPHKQRSKYICRPEAVVEVGNHFVWEFAKGHTSYNVPSDDGILHHYRICEFGGDDCVKLLSTVDRTAFKYRTELVAKVRSVYKNNKDRCQLDVGNDSNNFLKYKIR